MPDSAPLGFPGTIKRVLAEQDSLNEDLKSHQPSKAGEATELLREEADVKVVAGGQIMMPLLRQDLVSPDALVDITDSEGLDKVSVSDEAVELGALVMYTDLLEHPIYEGSASYGSPLRPSVTSRFATPGRSAVALPTSTRLRTSRQYSSATRGSSTSAMGTKRTTSPTSLSISTSPNFRRTRF